MTAAELPPILVDSREPWPDHPWVPYFTGPVIKGTLPTGDISLPGAEHLVCVERKTASDLISCLCAGRKRFSKELARAQAIPHFWVICEGSYPDVFKGHYRSQMEPQAAFQSIVALMTRYRIAFLMAGSVEVAARLAESLLLKWYEEHAKVLRGITKAMGAQRKGKPKNHRME